MSDLSAINVCANGIPKFLKTVESVRSLCSLEIGSFAAKCSKNGNISKDDVTVHLSSCMVTDNHHYDRCPHVDYIRDIVGKKGYENVVEGSFISKSAAFKREKGIHKVY